MSCNCTPQCSQEDKCLSNLNFKVDGKYLAPFIGSVPLEPVDLSPLLAEITPDDSFSLSIAEKALVFDNGNGDPDTVGVADVAALINLEDLGNVGIPSLENGDILSYNVSTSQWEPYTVPEGSIVSIVGINADGKMVKSLASAPLPGSVEVPLGGMIMFTGDEADLPSNFLPADGRAISRAVFADYFALVNTRFGPGNNSTTFNIPNVLGRTVVGYDEAQTEFDDIGKTGGEKAHVLNTNEMPAHSHHVNDPGHIHSGPFATNQIIQKIVNNADAPHGFSDGATTRNSNPSGTGIFLSNNGGNAAHNNLQPYISLIFAVRVA